jgi:hypothetical protein
MLACLNASRQFKRKQPLGRHLSSLKIIIENQCCWAWGLPSAANVSFWTDILNDYDTQPTAHTLWLDERKKQRQKQNKIIWFWKFVNPGFGKSWNVLFAWYFQSLIEDEGFGRKPIIAINWLHVDRRSSLGSSVFLRMYDVSFDIIFLNH